MVGRCEGHREGLGEVAGPAVEVRLEDDPQRSPALAPDDGRRRADEGGDLRGVVGVVVDDGDPADLTAHLEPPSRAGEPGQAGEDGTGVGTAPVDRREERAAGVEDVVRAGHEQVEGQRLAAALEGGP